jgi:hypothetical protein
MSFRTLSRADADHIVDRMLGCVIDALQRDERTPSLTRTQWREFLAGVEARCRDELGDLIAGRVHVSEQRRKTSSHDDVVDADQGPWPPLVAVPKWR